MTVGGSTSTSGTLNTKVVRTGTQKFVWNDFNMPVLTANGTIDNTNYTYACAFKGSGGSTSGNVYNAFNNNTANYFGYTKGSNDTRVLVFYTPYELKINSIDIVRSINKDNVPNLFYVKYYPNQITLPSNSSELNTSGMIKSVLYNVTTTKQTTTLTNQQGVFSNYHCFVISTYNRGSDTTSFQARIYSIVLYGKYKDGYQPTSGTADFTKPAYSVVKDGSIYKAIL